MAFDWHGKNSDGVPQFVGDGDRPTYWSVWGCFAAASFFAVGVGVIAFLALTGGMDLGPTATAWLSVAGPFDVLFFGGIGLWKLRLRRQIERLIPESNLGDRLGLEASEIQDVIRIKGIRPRLGVNLQSYYALEDFDDAATLLRSSAHSTNSESLLRAATPLPDDTASGLLRSSSHVLLADPILKR
jgi:hypothetical protein